MTHLQFDLPKEQSSIIKVIGVGGGGSNAVNHMFQQGIVGVNFVICNTDEQALHTSNIPNKIQLGPKLTQGLGAGSNPTCGKEATEESVEQIRDILSKNTKMVFVTAGMGGGTGTGGAPVVARIAREMGILTVGIVTTPFSFEGKRKFEQAKKGIAELREQVDTILIISNDKIREMFGNARQSEAFNHANNILTTAAKSISEIITVTGYVNVDFADVKYVMERGGGAIMGSAAAEGEGRAMKAVKGALNSPLLNDNDIRGAKRILVNISSGEDQVTIDEITEINEYIQESAKDTDIIFGTCDDPEMGAKLSVTLIATGFEPASNPDFQVPVKKTVLRLDDPIEVVENTPVATFTPPTIALTPPIKVETVHQLEEEVEELPVELGKPIIVEPIQIQEVIDEQVTLEPFMLLEEEEDFDNLFTSLSLGENKDAQIVEFDQSEITPTLEQTPVFMTAEESTEDTTTPSHIEAEAKEEDEGYEIFHKKSYTTYSDEEQVAPIEDLQDRKSRLLQLTHRAMNRSNIAELEQTPAYLRQGTQIDHSLPSTQHEASRYSVGVDATGLRPSISKNNTFLHDNVD